MNPAKRNARLFREKEKLSGSLFGKIKDFDFGENAEFNIDKLIESIKISIAGGVKNEYPFLLLWLEAPLQSWEWILNLEGAILSIFRQNPA